MAIVQQPGEGPRPGRVIIEGVTPEVDGGRFAVKRVRGDKVVVEADVFADGHDELVSILQYRSSTETAWREAPMRLLVNDRWRGEFAVGEAGDFFYRVLAWPDHFRTWHRDLKKRIDAGQNVEQELLVGAEMIREAGVRANGSDDAKYLTQRAVALSRDWDIEPRIEIALDEELFETAVRHADRSDATMYDRGQRVQVDRERAGFSAWYELFPRSASPDPARHGTFRDVIDRLPYVAGMGFDVLYLPPIHPIGHTNRKGRNNNPDGEEGALGSPWAIGSEAGGHKSIHPDLGTLEEFRELVAAVESYGMEIALDIAFQCSPDHPYVKEHPDWFRHRPDGSIRYAENPPKRYEDIYPINFESEDWRALWVELESVFLFWVEQGVRIFRVDNPHTKAFPFWEWVIARVRAAHPDVLFLSESFTRPKTMYYLAKIGFSQSYTYFTWRNHAWDLGAYITELTETPVREYFRPNFWPNTPDILNEHLQYGGRPSFISRLVLAATLSGNYGIYGPTYELAVNTPREEGSEEYRDSEKYEQHFWDLEATYSLREIIRRVNAVRKSNPALHQTNNVRLLQTTNEHLFAYMKRTEDGANEIVVVVNLDAHHAQSGWLQIPFWEMDLGAETPYQMHDQIDGARYMWRGEWNYVELNPQVMPAHLFVLRRHERSENEFDYFL